MLKNLGKVMKSYDGRQFIFELLEMTGAERNDYSVDEIPDKILAGQRSIGLEILNQLRSLPTVDAQDGLLLEYNMRYEARQRQRIENKVVQEVAEEENL